MLISEALEITGGLSEPSKMPGWGYSIPAWHCGVGAQLRKVPGSVCAGCYAMKGRYHWPRTRDAMELRLASLDHPQWVEAMALLIRSKVRGRGDGACFRWHDSGDLQSSEHLLRIAEVCRLTPRVRHWLPTREKGIVWHVRTEIAAGRQPELPRNLVVRLAAAMVDAPPPCPSEFPHTSTVHMPGNPWHGKLCEAYKRGGKCGPCRACWDRRVPNVSYPLH